jgi:SEC-C motif domain protein
MSNQELSCLCCSGCIYKECCQIYHQGNLPKNAEMLMRSRYAAYALGFTHYIIKTTHLSNPAFSTDTVKWKQEIENFSRQTVFDGLEILHFQEGDHEAFVSFIAYLKQAGKNASFFEKSRFVKEGDMWFYAGYEQLQPILKKRR